MRAKHALDRLAALVQPTARVVRDGTAREVHVNELVVDDLVQVQAGDQVVADGAVEASNGLTLDESILTGEARPVERAPGEEVRSGSFAVEGAGAYRVTAVGPDSYAERVAGVARTFRHPRSPLERALNRLLFALVAVIVPLGLILGVALWERREPLDEAVPTSVAAVVTLIPEGLILLTSLTFAVAALRMARRGALAQQLNAIESLASVDLICLDKTGTITEPTLRVVEVIPAEGVDEERLKFLLGGFAAGSANVNATVVALREAFPQPAVVAEASIPFASRYKWSGVRFGGASYLLGAPERFPLGPLKPRCEEIAAAGRRVLAFAQTDSALGDVEPDVELPGAVHLLGAVVLGEQLRPQARQTVEFFQREGVAMKVISGDRPETVAAIAKDAGIPETGPPVDGGALPEDPAELRKLVLKTSVIGRISPDGKRRVIEALRDSGRYVAMVGDGVNDVPALKAARLAIAQGTGTHMAKSVADVVLVSGDFAAVPGMVAEGRKIFRNLQRVTKLFLTKSAFAVFLVLSVGLTPIAYPLLPRHLTVAASLTIGIPAFFLALAPSSGGMKREGFLRDVARFAVPAGVAAGLAVLSSYLFTLNVLDRSVLDSRTVATTTLIGVGLFLILALEASGERRSVWVTVLCAAMLLLYILVLALPFARRFFELAAPDPVLFLVALAGTGIAIAGLWLTDERFLPDYGRTDRPRL